MKSSSSASLEWLSLVCGGYHPFLCDGWDGNYWEAVCSWKGTGSMAKGKKWNFWKDSSFLDCAWCTSSRISKDTELSPCTEHTCSDAAAGVAKSNGSAPNWTSCHLLVYPTQGPDHVFLPPFQTLGAVDSPKVWLGPERPQSSQDVAAELQRSLQNWSKFFQIRWEAPPHGCPAL